MLKLNAFCQHLQNVDRSKLWNERKDKINNFIVCFRRGDSVSFVMGLTHSENDFVDNDIMDTVDG